MEKFCTQTHFGVSGALVGQVQPIAGSNFSPHHWADPVVTAPWGRFPGYPLVTGAAGTRQGRQCAGAADGINKEIEGAGNEVEHDASFAKVCGHGMGAVARP